MDISMDHIVGMEVMQDMQHLSEYNQHFHSRKFLFTECFPAAIPILWSLRLEIKPAPIHNHWTKRGDQIFVEERIKSKLVKVSERLFLTF